MTTENWHEIVARRPVFTVDYWPGTPATTKEGRSDLGSDIQHFKSYGDPVTVRSLSFSYQEDKVGGHHQRGGMSMPALLNLSDTALRRWQKQVRRKLEPFLKQYRQAGLQLLDLHTLFHVSGRDHSPSWYHDVKDWEECDYNGTPLSQIDGRAQMTCLLHPKCYQILDRTFQALSFFNDEPGFLGFHVENEPHLGSWRKLETVGGNPHTRRAFRAYIKRFYRDVKHLNRVAGTDYQTFSDVDIADDHWLIQAMAARFRATWILGVYQRRAVAAVKKHLPRAVTISRLEVGYWLSEYQNGREVCGVELTYLKNSKLDVVGWSHIWNARDQLGQRGFGDFNVAAALLRGTGKMIGFTEPNVQRYGSGQWCAFRADELLHFIYRGLHFNFRMFNLHSWDREGTWAIYNEPYGAVYSKHPGTLRMVAQLRSELDRSEPFKTFGEPLPPPLGILVSREARHYPGIGGWAYGNLLAQLGYVLETPQFSHFEVIEEQSRDVDAAIKRCTGLVVSDACLTQATRRRLARFVRDGGKLLVFGAPVTVTPDYAPAKLPNNYPVATLSGHVDAATRRPQAVKITRKHPVFKGLSTLKLQRPTPIEKTANAVKLGPFIAANRNVVYISGIPTDLKQQKVLLDNFQQWCGLEPPAVFTAQFESATIVQNWDTSNHRVDGSVVKENAWSGSVAIQGRHTGTFREMREDHLWLAYHREGDGTVLESVLCEPKDVKVFRKENAKELPHIEGLPDTLGFSYWWNGLMHPIIGRFVASTVTKVNARIVGLDRARWLVCEVGGRKIAEGRGLTMRFSVRPRRQYYLSVMNPTHMDKFTDVASRDPLLTDHAFE